MAKKTASKRANEEFKIFLRSLGKLPKFSKRAEEDLIRQIIEKNSKSAKQRLAEGYILLVVKIAKKYRVNNICNGVLPNYSCLEMIEDGMIGLFRAIGEVKRKSTITPFRHFASIFIEHGILEQLINHILTVYL